MTDQIIHNAAFTVTDKIALALNIKPKFDGVTNVIDISAWQDPALIDYDKLASEIDGAILRIGYGVWKDKQFETHYKNLHDRGVAIGCYHYIIGNYGGLPQAQALQSWAPGYDFALDYWGDVEDTREGTALTSKIVDSYLGNCDNLLDTLMGVYTSMYRWREIMKDSKAHGHRRLWVAHYTASLNPFMPAGWSKFYLHQYTDRARFTGYTHGGIDCSRYNGTEADWYAQFETTQPAPIEPSDAEKLARLWQAHPELH